ncbi:FMN-binding negative transcriptional regulator [Eudoraea chungangensis]|uniref:FMN-binding negative transcriptional regulator n=1 Tax=Eudoraea chungangensis TaxID=1481905 RepID=UPI0023EA96B2|nr:FMN-binding negative transcriptional regulator [Eudoraea chungangensis]
MYIPSKYENTNLKEVKEFIQLNAFGILTSLSKGRLWATHIPLELEIREGSPDVLVGHIAKANEQWKGFDNNQEVLCIFNGPHSYVSSSWYEKEEVPTWNYIAVHVYGTIKIQNEREVLAAMHRLVDKYEKHSKQPLSLKNLSPKTLKQVRGVVGFEIKIEEIKAAYKLSQGREEDHTSIIKELNNLNNPASSSIAKEMQKKR